MPNFLLSRIAVNLLLIVAIAIQPVALCWAQSSCGRGVTRSHGVDGCGCCGDTDTSKCCCQAKTAGDPVDSEVDAAGDQNSKVPACCATERGGQGNARSVDAAHDAKLIESALTAIESVNQDTRFHSVCLCGFDSKPLRDTTPRRATNDARDSIALIAFNSGGPLTERRRPPPTRLENVRAVLPTHFTQLHLCIWRL